MKRSPIAVALIVVGGLAFGWWQSVGRAPRAPSAAAIPRGPETAPVAAVPRAPAPDPYDLARDERQGGHTLARHVGRTDAQLFDRLRREPNISAASTYTDRAAAERTVARALAASRARVDAWLARQGPRPNLPLDYRGRPDEFIGRSARRGRATTAPSVHAVVVLRWAHGRDFFVLTTYPEESP